MKHDKPNGPDTDANSVGDTSRAPAPRGAVQRQISLMARLIGKAGQVSRHILTSPAIRSHVISIIQSEGLPGIFRRLRRMRSNLARNERNATMLQVKPLSYEVWSQRFDTPNTDELTALITTASRTMIDVIVHVASGQQRDLQTTLEALHNAVRKPSTIKLAFTTDVSADNRALWQAMIDKDQNNLVHPANTEIHSTQGTLPHCTVLIPAGYTVPPHAFALLATEFARKPDSAFLYGDEARSENGKLQHWFKPDFSPLMARSGRLLTGIVAFNRRNVSASAFIDALTSADDTALKIVEWATQQPRTTIGHLPHVLSTTAQPLPPKQDVTPPLVDHPIVSIIIPTRNFWSVLKPCLDSLKTTHWPVECLDIIVVDNGSDDPETLSGLHERVSAGEIRVIRHDYAFNWSELNNVGAMHAKGSVLVFLNNDIEVIEPDWLKKLVAFATLPQAGAVGCKLLYPDRTIQHGGVVIGIQGVAGHAHLFITAGEEGYNGLANINREISAVTGACIAVEKRKFDAVGGFDESFRIAFNDIAFCVTLAQAGLDNIYVADALLLHHESKSRGYDTTPEKIERNRLETIAFWNKFQSLIRDDRYYSPNLSYRDTYKLSDFPRRKPHWAGLTPQRSRVLMLSITHAKGHGVPVVLAMQAEALLKAGFEVIVAGPQSGNDFPYDGCRFLEVHDPEAAALAALLYRVDCVVAHTPPFFSTVRWLGSDFPFMAYDYGEPPPAWFDDAVIRHEVAREKETSFAMADCVYAISQAIRDESVAAYTGIIPLGNSHLGIWQDGHVATRQAVRERLGWQDRFVILNVCRFHRAERRYKGVDRYADTMRAFKATYPDLAARCVFVLCGKGAPRDVKDMQQEGLAIFPNVTDETMAELYMAADAYLNFSQWEGYNLGIAQALAMGLPTFASDIPAHRAFGIEVSNDPAVAGNWLNATVQSTAQGAAIRQPTLWIWDTPLTQFVDCVRDMIARERQQH